MKEKLKKLLAQIAAMSAIKSITAEQATELQGLMDEADTLKLQIQAAEMADGGDGEIKALSTQIADLSAIVAQLVSKEPAKKEQPTKNLGHVVADEADRTLEGKPFKGWGDFLITLVGNPHDKRLRPLRGQDGFYDCVKAVGPAAIGSVTQRAMKATGLSEGIPADGGFLVGTDHTGGILGRMYDVGKVLPRTDMVGISANSNGMTFNSEAETSRVDGSRRGGILAYWACEAEEKTKSKPAFRKMELTLRKVIGLVYATDELLQDASALESWIMRNLPEELNFKVEDSIFSGTGAGMPLGILASGAIVTVAKEAAQVAATIVADNISKMWARRWLGGRNYAWYINQDVEPELDNLNMAVGTGGQLVYMPAGGLSASPFGSIKGRPVIPVEYCPTLGTVGDIILADFSEYQMIEKGGVQSASSIHVKFVEDETVFRFVYRVDGQPKWNLPLTPYKGTNTVSPFVVLATRA